MADTEPREPPSQVAKDLAATVLYAVGVVLGLLVLMALGLAAILAVLCSDRACVI